MQEKYSFEDFVKIIEKLRAKDGCPWDREQTHDSLRVCMMEEAAEFVSSVRICRESGSAENMREELGDILLQVVMHGVIAEEEGLFTLEDVITTVSEKMIRRHPHIFGTAQAETSAQVLRNWDEIKKKEKQGKMPEQTGKMFEDALLALCESAKRKKFPLELLLMDRAKQLRKEKEEKRENEMAETAKEMKEILLNKFEELFGDAEGATVCFAPGRVNLIGEHTDYNGGHVFPCALTIGTYGIAKKRADKKLRFYSMNFERVGVQESAVDALGEAQEGDWTNYPKGVIWAFAKRHGFKLPCGMDFIVYGNIPNGSGLSSSASLEVLTGFVLRELYGFDVENVDLAVIGQYAENHYNGMNCGIMDQFASAMGKKDNAIFLDTATYAHSYVPIVLEGAKIVVTNSKVKHSLVNSAYNQRRSECETALAELQKVVDIKGLGDLSEEDFEKHKSAIKDEVRLRRAKHAVYENQRTIRAVEALNQNDLKLFGELMNASHVSLRDDYEVSCEEIDILVEEAWKIPGAIGSRITGGGFGGCTVSIVKDEAIDTFKEQVGKAYEEKTGKNAEFYIVEVGDGPRVLWPVPAERSAGFDVEEEIVG